MRHIIFIGNGEEIQFFLSALELFQDYENTKKYCIQGEEITINTKLYHLQRVCSGKKELAIYKLTPKSVIKYLTSIEIIIMQHLKFGEENELNR